MKKHPVSREVIHYELQASGEISLNGEILKASLWSQKINFEKCDAKSIIRHMNRGIVVLMVPNYSIFYYKIIFLK